MVQKYKRIRLNKSKMKFKLTTIKIYLVNKISYLIIKSLFFKKNNYSLLIKLYQYIYINTKFNIKFNKNIINDNHISVELLKENQNIKIISLIFSHNILNNITTMKRSKECLNHWIPLLIKLSSKTKKKIIINLNCGDKGSSDYLSMDSKKNTNLIPDLYSLNAAKKINKKLPKISFEEFKKIWLIKESKMYWRGGTTGDSYKNIKELNKLKRIEICKRFRESKDIDIKISRITQNDTNKEKIKKYLIQEKIFGKEVSENKFINYKYYPDIPGNSLAWGTITKYLGGSLIFKAEVGKHLYYYNLLKEWIHYIPVNNDFSDLEEKLIWSEKNQTKSLEIAYSGYIIILEYLKNIDNHFMNTSMLHLEKNDVICQ